MQTVSDTVSYAFGWFGWQPQVLHFDYLNCYGEKYQNDLALFVCRVIYYWLTWPSGPQQLDDIFMNMSTSWNKNIDLLYPRGEKNHTL